MFRNPRSRTRPGESVDAAQVPSSPSPWGDIVGVTATRALQALILILLAGVVVYALVRLKIVVIPVLIALIIASAFAPVMAFLRKHRLPNALAAAVCLVASVVVVGGIITLIVNAVQNDWDKLYSKATAGISTAVDWFLTLNLPIDDQKIDELLGQVTGFLTSGAFASGALSGVSAISEIATGFVLSIVILFFFLKDGPVIWGFLTSALPGKARVRAQRVGFRSVLVLGGYVRGTAMVAAVDAIGIGLALFILQVPLALPLSIIVFAGGFIPLLGATVAGILAALVALVTNGLVGAIIVIAVVILVNQLEGNLLQPVLMGNALKLHPLVILVALTIGTVLGGIIGAVLAVPLAAVGWTIVKALWEPVTTRDIALLRATHPRLTT